jgi:hypothetical protein
MTIAPISSAANIAAAGLQTAMRQFSAAASSIVTQTISAGSAATGSAIANTSAAAIQAQSLAGGDDLPAQIVNADEARTAFAASLAVYKATQSDFKTLLDALA